MVAERVTSSLTRRVGRSLGQSPVAVNFDTPKSAEEDSSVGQLEAFLLGNLVTVVLEYEQRVQTPSVRQEYEQSVAAIVSEFVESLTPRESTYFEEMIFTKGGNHVPRIQAVRESGIALGKAAYASYRAEQIGRKKKEEHRGRSKTRAQKRKDTLRRLSRWK